MNKFCWRTRLELLILAVVWLQCSAGARSAQDAGRPFLVTTEWLAEHLADPGLVLLHIGDKAQYESGHIPGARFVSLSDLSTPFGTGLTLQMPSASELQAKLEKLGISDTSRVVVYFGEDGITPAARVWLTLQYVGLGGQSSILNGGMPAWKAEKRPVSVEVRTPVPGRLTPRLRNDVIAELSWVSERLHNPKYVIVDARAANFYEGSSAGRMPRAGHIPGAVNIPFSSVVDDSVRLKSADELRDMFRAAGVKPGQTVITYCHIGQQASLLYFVARYLGYDARLYDGSFEEWSRRADLPVVTGTSPEK